MLRHQGGDHVKAGFYLDLDSWEIKMISGREGATLEGSPATRYLRIPTLGMLIFAPLMGAAFAIFLPFIGIAMVLQYLAVRGWRSARHAAQAMVGTLAPAWQPGTAHLAGTGEAPRPQATAPPAPETAARLKELERIIEEREEHGD
jgi:hypothetical protein